MEGWRYDQLLTVDRRLVYQCGRVVVWPAVDCGLWNSLLMWKGGAYGQLLTVDGRPVDNCGIVGVWPVVDCG